MNWTVFSYIVLGLAVSGIGFYFFSVFYASYCIYNSTLVRKNKDMWGRQRSSDDPLSVKMDEEGLRWQAEHARYKKDVHITRDGMNLYGEYYDMGYDKAVIILSGRTESLRYGYFFATPYSSFGCNVLVIDPRSHGLSDGKYNTVGFEEGPDALQWAKFLLAEYQLTGIVFHGICIGAAGGMYAITSPDCPAQVKGIVTEGMFANFGESMKNHLIERKKLMWPVMQCIDFWMKHYTGHSMTRGPIDFIDKLEKPLLMIQSKKDKYSTVTNAKKLYELCPSREKKLVLYETGDHSMLRITDTRTYDTEIQAFLSKIYSAGFSAE
jgi:fermentation-respiration switch protein FrsA (DUF1100 family)